MRDPKCRHCRGRKICRDEQISWFFIAVGFISTVAIRAVTVLMSFDPLAGKISWYIGVLGFCVFFLYKYNVFKDRSALIDELGLLDKVNAANVLTQQDYEVIATILCKIRSNKERINFLFIFIVSGIALCAAIYFDFIV